MPGDIGNVTLHSRERGGKLNFDQISYTTDCVREVAKILEIPMAKAISHLRAIDGGFPAIYKEARKDKQRLTARSLAKKMCLK